MRPQQIDLPDVERGGSYDATLRWGRFANGVFVALPGDGTWPHQWEAKAQVRNRHGGEVWADLRDGSGIELAGANEIRLHLSDEQTERMRTNGLWDLFLRRRGGEWQKAAKGAVLVNNSVAIGG